MSYDPKILDKWLGKLVVTVDHPLIPSGMVGVIVNYRRSRFHLGMISPISWNLQVHRDFTYDLDRLRKAIKNEELVKSVKNVTPPFPCRYGFVMPEHIKCKGPAPAVYSDFIWTI